MTELDGEGFDSIYALASFALAAGAAVELLATADWRAPTALDLSGNELTNAVTGNSGVNRLADAAGDRIDLSAIDADAGGGSADDAFAFVRSAAYSGAARELRATETSPGLWLLERDVNGDRVTDLLVEVSVADGHAPGGTVLRLLGRGRGERCARSVKAGEFRPWPRS